MTCFSFRTDHVLRRCALAFFILGLFSIWTASSVTAAPVYMAPPSVPPSPTPDGSARAPYHSLAEAVVAVTAGQGDHVALMDGHYGARVWSGIRPAETVLVRAADPGQAHFDYLDLNGLRNLHFMDLSVWPRSTPAKRRPIVRSDSASAHITVEGFDIRGREDGANYMQWSLADWQIWQGTGLQILGPNVTARGNRLTAVGGGISSSRAGAVVVDNVITGFSGDGLRGIGDNSLFRGNRVQDCVDVDANHDDGFQSWSPRNQGAAAAIANVTIAENIILEWTGDRSHPLRCNLQGIGLFDGFYRNFEIVNNLLVVSAYHGIALYGGRDSVIVHNTVVHPETFTGQAPWVTVRPHRNGTPSKNVEVRNNVAMSYSNLPQALAENVAVASAATLFQSPATGDFTPRANGPLVDGVPTIISITDVFGTRRPQGRHNDFGAIERP
ncbi:right-handed parallel beta-helix repeat-containing protein [Epibacterium ulvae]|uniref:right-handed parallel beta-helix repeat-containing protein n=1 Tax=Epibacterium ulvae TaxID=1156985 RepID=UPI001BFC4C34|nr:right-handed parallel beta-helix repeat-containing protein [Epibacterium ulvae]MBT8154553.1 right-handed parallel beta-helix repeat-containing protein [Epibacterium ulvae]